MAPMLHLARGHSLRESGLFSFQSLSTDLVLAMLGVAIAAFWHRQPVADPVRRRPAAADPPLAERPAAAGGGARRPEDGPLQRAALRGRAERGAVARRALRAAAVADHGRPRPAARHQQHLRPPRRRRGPAGHRRGLPRRSCATTTCPARFGGEEFAILLPETPPEQAFEIAERIRRTVAAARSTSRPRASRSAPPSRSASPAFPRDGVDANELIHQADLAVYRAKLQGRNRVLDASSEPLLLPEKRQARLVAVPEDGDHVVPLPPPPR